MTGRWQQPHLAPKGALVWTDLAGRGSSAQVAGQGRVVAVAHKVGQHRQWNLRIPGWLWKVTSEMGIARFNAIPGDKITETPVKAFKSLAAAKREAESIVPPSEPC